MKGREGVLLTVKEGILFSATAITLSYSTVFLGKTNQSAFYLFSTYI
jgi:hypothetical protein